MQVHPANGPWPSLAAALEAEQRAEGRTPLDAAGIWRLLAQLLVVLLAGLIAVSAFAKLPPPTDEAKLIAAEGAAKAAWADTRLALTSYAIQQTASPMPIASARP